LTETEYTQPIVISTEPEPIPEAKPSKQKSKVDIILSGDPDRKQFFENMKLLYESYSFINTVWLFFERNPAIPFNRASRESAADVLFCTADVYVPPSTIRKMIETVAGGKADVVFILPSSCKRNENLQFCSGAFAVNRVTLLKFPMPESPDFLEEILWQNSTLGKLSFKPHFAFFEHLHKHTIGHLFHFNRLRTNERAKLKNRGRIANFFVFIDLFVSTRSFIFEQRKRNPDMVLHELLSHYKTC
jgi:hypothetical protein